MTKPTTKPLAWAKDGTPLEVSDETTAWQVRRLSGEKGGRPAVVYGEDGGPLFLDVDAGIEELRAAAGPGRYRLEQVDDEFQKTSKEEAVVVVQEGDESEEQARDSEERGFYKLLEAQQRMLDGLLTTVKAQQQTMAKAMETQSQNLAAVMNSSARVLDVHNGTGITQLVDGLPERFEKFRNAVESGGADDGGGFAEMMNGPMGVMLTSALKAVVEKLNQPPVPAPKVVGDGTNTG